MADLNLFLLVGNLVADPELRDIGSDRKVVNFTIASNRSWNDSNGEKQEEVSFIECAAFGKTAETINNFLSKGRKIFAEGRIKQERWPDKDTQENRSKLKFMVEKFTFMDAKKDDVPQGVPAEAGSDLGAAPIGVEGDTV